MNSDLQDFLAQYSSGNLLLDPKLVDLYQVDPQFGPQIKIPGRGKVEVLKVGRELIDVFFDFNELKDGKVELPPIWISAEVSTGRGFPILCPSKGKDKKEALYLHKSTYSRDGRFETGKIVRPDSQKKPTGGAQVIFDKWNTSGGMGRQSAYILVLIPEGGTVPLDNHKALTFDGEVVKEEYVGAPPKRYQTQMAGSFKKTGLFGSVFYNVSIRWKAVDPFYPEISGEVELRFSDQPNAETIWSELSKKDSFAPDVFHRHSVDLLVQETKWDDECLYRVEKGIIGYNRKRV